MSKLLLVALLLVGCDTIDKERTRAKLVDTQWDKGEIIDVTYYKTHGDDRFLQTFEMDGYKFVIYCNGYGSDMEVIIPLDTNSNELDEYIHMLEEENQLLGSLLAEKEIKEDE